MQIKITFDRHKPLVIALDQTPVTETFLKVLRRNLYINDFVFRDPIKYTPAYFTKLCLQVKEALGWDWIKDEYSLSQTTKMHKFIESALDKTESFKKIPGDQQNLIHEAHFCIHQMQYGKNERKPFIQIEWFNDDHEPLPPGVNFDYKLQFGDLILQNPYVGHPPLQCWQQNDYKDIFRTCQFHDIVKPGIKISTMNTLNVFDSKDLEDYKSWWLDNCGDYVKEVGWDKIKYYTGFPKIGQVVDKDNLQKIINDAEPLNITKIEL